MCDNKFKFCFCFINRCDRVLEGRIYFIVFMCVNEQSKNLKCIFIVNLEKDFFKFVYFNVVEI